MDKQFFRLVEIAVVSDAVLPDYYLLLGTLTDYTGRYHFMRFGSFGPIPNGTDEGRDGALGRAIREAHRIANRYGNTDDRNADPNQIDVLVRLGQMG